MSTISDKVNGLEKGYSMMECPHCKANNKDYNNTNQTWKFDKMLTPIRARFICGECDLGVQYET